MQWLRFADLGPAQLYEVLRFRQQIFVVEQRSPYPDLDGLDAAAWHLLLPVAGALAGYLRLVALAAPPRIGIGRVAVAAALRRQGHGRRLVEAALRRCAEQHPHQPIVLSAQTGLVPFYRGFGFAAASEAYDDYGVPHVDMAKPAG